MSQVTFKATKREPHPVHVNFYIKAKTATCSKCRFYYIETLTGRLWCWVHRRRQEYDLADCIWFDPKEAEP
jgi:hypothetical protein